LPTIGLGCGSRRFEDITDGASTTLMLAEEGGRPALWQVGKLVTAQSLAAPQPVDGAGWGDPRAEFGMDGSDPGTGALVSGGTCAMNCSNNNEIYAFHPSGSNVLFCDGSVRFISSRTNIVVMGALITAQGGEVIFDSSF
jgi:prepilin-type processing-associated H-X9-DG protein